MKKTVLNCLLASLLIILVNITLSAQDIIIRKNGKTVPCKVLEETEQFVKFKAEINGRTVITKLDHEYIEKILYDVETAPLIDRKRRAATIGFLNGGGSLIGVDLEFLLGRNFGFYVGGGLVGFGGGLTYHLKNDQIASSYFAVRYMHQGVGDSHYATYLGPAFVFRAKKILEASIGVGYVLEKGPGANSDLPDALLTYTLGAFFSF